MIVDPLSALKQIRQIIRKSSDRELVRLILDLQRDFFALARDNLRLKAEIASLKRESLSDKRTRTGPGPQAYYYFERSDDAPFCPKCWDSRGTAIRLSSPEQVDGRIRRECPVCKTTFWEVPSREKARAAAG
jgi:hypothetical protein